MKKLILTDSTSDYRLSLVVNSSYNLVTVLLQSIPVRIMVHGTLLTLSDLSLLVDGFSQKDNLRKEVQHFILTHFHSDHTAGLGKGFKHGIIYCTKTTKDLIVGITGVGERWVRGIEVGKRKKIYERKIAVLES